MGRYANKPWVKHRLTYTKIGGPSAGAELKALLGMARNQGSGIDWKPREEMEV